jgi:tRNA (guanine37-N1)-methyltransferase
MKFTFVTLFPNLCQGYFSESILSRAIENKIIDIEFINPREFTTDRHNRVDNPQIGGGAGLTLMPQPLSSVIDSIKQSSKDAYIIFTLPAAKPFRQVDSLRLSKKKHIVLISGRYEGFDERTIEEYADEIFSIGDFILTGGELPSLSICDSISRCISGVVGNVESLQGESFENNLLEPPGFTKPNNYKNSFVIKEYLKGDHAKIHHLKNKLSLYKTKFFRPDLYKRVKIRGKLDEK